MRFRGKRKNSKEFKEKFSTKTKKKFFTKTSALAWILTIVILIGMFWGYMNTERKIQSYQATIDELSQSIKDLERTNKDLEEQMDSVDSDEYIERIARERLGMVKKGEVVLKQSNNEEATTEDKKEKEEKEDKKSK